MEYNMKRFHTISAYYFFEYALLEYTKEDFEKARYTNNIHFDTIGRSLEITSSINYLKCDCILLKGLTTFKNDCLFINHFNPCKIEANIAINSISECIEKEKIIKAINSTISKLHNIIPKSPYRDCIEKYYQDMKKFVESVEVDK